MVLPLLAQQQSDWQDRSPHRVQFVTVDAGRGSRGTRLSRDRLVEGKFRELLPANTDVDALVSSMPIQIMKSGGVVKPD